MLKVCIQTGFVQFFALGHKDKLNLDYEQFDWPINNNSVDCTLESAKDIFFSWLKRKKN